MFKKRLLIFMIMLASVVSPTFSAFAEPDSAIYMENSNLSAPNLESEAAILTDLKSGRVIYSKNPGEKLYPASTTKIMTGILALEYGNLSDTVTAGVAALAPITNEDSHMGILIGEQFTLEQLIYGMMVYSANDAANVIACHIGGTSENFVQLMNQKAQELGAVNTHFVNAYGIQDENHYTTAEDLVLITRYAMQNEKFREIVKTPIYTIPPTEKYPSERKLPSTNLFLGNYRSAEFYNQSVTGVKTGSTSDAGYCLVTTAADEATELLTVTLKAPNKKASYTDTQSLLNFGFKNYSYITVAAAGNVINDSKVYEAKDDTRVALTIQNDISALLPKETDVAAEIVPEVKLPEVIKSPIQKGQVIGEISYTYNGTVIGTEALVAANDVKRNNLLFLYHLIIRIITSPLFFIPAILIIILLIIRHMNIKKQERLKRKRRLQNAQKAAANKNRSSASMPPSARSERYSELTSRKNPNSRYK